MEIHQTAMIAECAAPRARPSAACSGRAHHWLPEGEVTFIVLIQPKIYHPGRIAFIGRKVIRPPQNGHELVAQFGAENH
jgi:hypothetical protein